MFTPAIDFAIGRCRTVTSRAQPASVRRICESENEYLNEPRLPRSVPGGVNSLGLAACERRILRPRIGGGPPAACPGPTSPSNPPAVAAASSERRD